jgi:hypothetical protein
VSAAGDALVSLANGTAPAFKGLRQGRYDFSRTVSGVGIYITYDLEGNYCPAGDDGPADLPDVVIRTANIGGTEVGPIEADEWIETLSLWCDLDEEAREVNA